MRRDQVLLTAPINNEAFTALTYQAKIEIDIGARKLRGYYRASGPGHKFLKSQPFEIDLTDAVIDTLMTYVHARNVAAIPALAGARSAVEVADVDQDPAIG